MDPADEAARWDLERTAAAEAERRWAELDRRERVLLAAREAGAALSHPALEQAARCRKSVLYSAYRALLARLASQLRRDFRGEDSAVLAALSRGVLDAWGRRALDWAKSENALSPLFSVTAGRDGPPAAAGLCGRGIAENTP